jgi:hypothetical protein
VRITATASGFDSNDAQADVRQSTFHLFPATTSISALSTTFSVGIDPNGLGCCQRASEAVSIDVAASDPTVLNPATPLSIASNASSTGSQALNTVGAGVATLVASTLGAAINPGNSAAINVLPTIASIAPLAGQAGTTANVAIVGTNLSNASSVTVSGTGVSVGLVGKTNTEIDLTFTIDPLAEPATRTVTVATPGGSVTTGFLVTAATLTTARLTDMTQFLANSSGATTGTFFHNTNVDTQAFQLGVTSPAVALPSGTAVSFLNPGAEDINLPLSLGTNTFTIVGDQTTASSPFGLNLFFNDEVIPGITVFNANGGTGAFSIEAPETSTTGFATGGPGPVPASGVTSAATSDGFAVTLTSYTMKSSSSPFVDLMNGFTAGSSNGTADTVGSFTLDVTRPGNFQSFAVQGSAAPAGFDALSPPGSRTTITFDDPNFPDGSANPSLGAGARGVEITTQYASLGVSFGTAAGNIQSFVFGAFGGLITTKSLGNNIFNFQGPIAATFTTVKSSVGVIVTDDDASVGAATLTAYAGPNGTGVALASVSSPGGTGNDPFFLGLVDTSGSPRIRSVIVRFQRVSGSDLTADNLTFAP